MFEDEDIGYEADPFDDMADKGEESEQHNRVWQQLAEEQKLIEELEADAAEHPFEDNAGDEEPERKKLKRELWAEALARLEDAARTQRDFENVVAWWDKLDANQERRERYHELSRSSDDVPLDYGASASELFFPDMLNAVLEKQIRKGDFIDAIFYCPYDIHELVSEEYLSKILLELSEDHKELLFLCAVRLFSSTRIAAIRQQSDRNIRKVRGTMLKKIRKKLLAALPTTPNFMEYEAVYLPKNHFIKEENMSTEDYLDLFFPFDKPDVVKRGVESMWNIENDRVMMAIVWDFHSMLLGVQMMFSFMLTDSKNPIRLCRHCTKAFVASRPSTVFCSPQCKNKHNVYKSRAKNKNRE